MGARRRGAAAEGPRLALARLRLRGGRRGLVAAAAAGLALVPTAIATRDAVWAPDPPPLLPPSLRAPSGRRARAPGPRSTSAPGSQRGVAWRLSATACRYGHDRRRRPVPDRPGRRRGRALRRRRRHPARDRRAPRPDLLRPGVEPDVGVRRRCPRAPPRWPCARAPYGGGATTTTTLAASAVGADAIAQGHLPPGPARVRAGAARWPRRHARRRRRRVRRTPLDLRPLPGGPMPSRRLTLPAVSALALACIALGVLAALADGSGRRAGSRRGRCRAPSRRRGRPGAGRRGARAPARLRPAPARDAAARSSRRRRRALPAARSPSAAGSSGSRGPVGATAPRPEPVPDDLLHAFGILRRAATPDDALPEEALTALRRARPGALRPRRRAPGPHDARRRPRVGRPDPRRPRHAPAAGAAAARAARRRLQPEDAGARAAGARAPSPAAGAGRRRYAAHPGLALVALGGAPVGAGGRYEDLIRGREHVALDPCGGPGHDMLSVSGLVPDGVPAAFLTSPDGTAIRADVKDNAYTFVVPRSAARRDPLRRLDRRRRHTPRPAAASPTPSSPPHQLQRRSTTRPPRIPSISPTPCDAVLPAPVAVKRLPTLPRHK